MSHWHSFWQAQNATTVASLRNDMRTTRVEVSPGARGLGYTGRRKKAPKVRTLEEVAEEYSKPGRRGGVAIGIPTEYFCACGASVMRAGKQHRPPVCFGCKTRRTRTAAKAASEKRKASR